MSASIPITTLPGGTALRRACGIGGLLFTMALFARTANLASAFVGGVPQVVPYDDIYHARRILYSAAHPGQSLSFDPGRGATGAFCPWPPLYDVTVGALTVALGAKDSAGVLARALWIPPIVSALFIGAAAALLAWRRGTAAGLVAGCSLAFAPAFLDASRLGSLDHHFLEPPLLLLVAVSTAWLLEDSPVSPALRALALSGALLLALFVQTALLAGAALALVSFLFRPGLTPRRALHGALAFGVVAAVVFLYRVTQPAGYPDSEWFLGLPHAAALLGAASVCISFAYLSARGAGPLSARGAALAVGCLTATAVPEAVSGMLAGSGFFGGDPWLNTISEFEPLFRGSLASSWSDLTALGGGAFLVLPFAIMAARRPNPLRVTLAVFSVGLVVMAVARTRFVVPATGILAISSALLVKDLLARGKRLLAAGAALVTLLPGASVSLPELLAPARPVVPAAALPILRALTPLRAAAGPGSRLLVPWSWGHLVHVSTGLPVIVDGFGVVPSRVDFENATAILLAPSEEWVASYCEARRIGLVVLENPLRLLPRYAETIGADPAAYLRAGKNPDDPPAVTHLAQATFWWRAYFDHGRPRPEMRRAGAPFKRFRLIYSDSEIVDVAPYRGPALQVWELAGRVSVESGEDVARPLPGAM